MNRILITGTNRGIGLEFTHQYLQQGWQVHACCRSPENAQALMKLRKEHPDTLHIHVLDVCNAAQRQNLVYELGDTPIDILLNNAGVYGPFDMPFGELDTEQWLKTLETNTVAPLLLSQALAANVAASEKKIIATLSSKMGSISDNGSGGSYLYRSSKAALNAALYSQSIDLSEKGITTLMLHPGWVRTDMGGPNGEINTEQSVTQMRATLDNASAADNGRFIDIDGSTIPW